HMTSRRKIYVEGTRGVRVPFSEVTLSPTVTKTGVHENPPIRLYDTSGPGSDPAAGLPPLRRHWILERGDVEEYEGRTATARDDGRAAGRRGTTVEQFAGDVPRPLRAKAGRTVTQLHYARRGEVTPEMEFVAVREGLDPEVVR